MRLIKRRNIPTFLLHLTGCLALLSLPLLLSPESLSLHAYLTNPPTQRDLVAYILALTLFYVNFFFLIPTLYFRRRYLLYILFNLILFTAFITVPNILIRPTLPRIQNTFIYPSPNPLPPNPTSRPLLPFPATRPPTAPFPPAPARFLFLNISRHLFLFLAAIIFGLLLRIRTLWKTAEQERVRAALSYLKAQINPHFLFNTLNTIYALALERSDKTPAAITRLSSMMRYVLLEVGRDKVPLEHELTYLSDYIALQQTRFEGALQLDFAITGSPDQKMIVPVLLIPFIENAFKHGVNPEIPATIRIHIDIRRNDLHLFVSNRKVATPLPDNYPGGLGIRNTRQRLDIFYPSRYQLNLDDDGPIFIVNLNLQLT